MPEATYEEETKTGAGRHGDRQSIKRRDVFKASRMPIVEELLREKRLRWFGHLMREDEDEPAKQILQRE